MAGGVEVVIEDLTHTYDPTGEHLVVLDRLDLTVPAGSSVSVMGSSGAGKSTLLALIGGLDMIQQGRIAVGGQDLRSLSRRALAHYRRSTVGFVFQQYGLLPTYTAVENVALAPLLAGDSRRHAARRALTWLDRVGVAHRAGHRPGTLSGGEQQRVALARALINEPQLILADEPTGNLDDTHGSQVMDLLAALSQDQGCTVITVTHDPTLARRADEHYRLIRGRLVGADR